MEDRRNYLGVSELGSCARRVVYAHTPGLEPVFTEETQRRLALGHLIEDLRRKELQEVGVEVFGEQQEVLFGPAKGHLDGYLRTPEGVLLLEVKSTSGFAISRWSQLPRHYALQCHGYMAGLSDLLGEEVPRFRIDVVDRASAELSTWVYSKERELEQEAMDRAIFLADAIASGSLPDREYQEDSAFCIGCPFKGVCRPGPKNNGAGREEPADASLWAGFGEAIDLYTSGQALKKEGEELASRAKDAILDALRRHNVLKARLNGTAVSWTPVETSRLDTKALQAEQPTLYSQYLKPSVYPRLTITQRR
jgi:hypothetical protein